MRFVKKLIEGITQLAIVITNEVVNRNITYVIRVNFTNWLCLTSLTRVIELIFHQLKFSREITKSQENPINY